MSLPQNRRSAHRPWMCNAWLVPAGRPNHRDSVIVDLSGGGAQSRTRASAAGNAASAFASAGMPLRELPARNISILLISDRGGHCSATD